jgi:hypothetical protein
MAIYLSVPTTLYDAVVNSMQPSFACAEALLEHVTLWIIRKHKTPLAMMQLVAAIRLDGSVEVNKSSHAVQFESTVAGAYVRGLLTVGLTSVNRPLHIMQIRVFGKVFGTPTKALSLAWYESLFNQYILGDLRNWCVHLAAPILTVHNWTDANTKHAAQLHAMAQPASSALQPTQSITDTHVLSSSTTPPLWSVLPKIADVYETNAWWLPQKSEQRRHLGMMFVSDVNPLVRSGVPHTRVRSQEITLVEFFHNLESIYDAVRDGPLPTVLAQIWFQVLYCLACFERRGVRHNDMHTRNVMLVVYDTVDDVPSFQYKFGAGVVRAWQFKTRFVVRIIDFDMAWAARLRVHNATVCYGVHRYDNPLPHTCVPALLSNRAAVASETADAGVFLFSCYQILSELRRNSPLHELAFTTLTQDILFPWLCHSSAPPTMTEALECVEAVVDNIKRSKIRAIRRLYIYTNGSGMFFAQLFRDLKLKSSSSADIDSNDDDDKSETPTNRLPEILDVIKQYANKFWMFAVNGDSPVWQYGVRSRLCDLSTIEWAQIGKTVRYGIDGLLLLSPAFNKFVVQLNDGNNSNNNSSSSSNKVNAFDIPYTFSLPPSICIADTPIPRDYCNDTSSAATSIVPEFSAVEAAHYCFGEKQRAYVM